jgi:hypothetical protein
MSQTTNENNHTTQCLARIKRRTRKLAKGNGPVVKLTDEQIFAVADAVAERQQHIETYVEHLLAHRTEGHVSEKEKQLQKEEIKNELNLALKEKFTVG